MPKFIVTKGQDAHVIWEKLIEAESAEEANRIAAEQLEDSDWVDTGDVRYYDSMTLLEGDTEEYVPEEQSVVTFTLTGRERDVVLAALRLWQETPVLIDLDEIAKGTTGESLTNAEIDELCERINV